MPLIKGPIGPAPSAGVTTDAAAVALRTGSAQDRWAAARGFATVSEATALLGRALADEADHRVREAIFTSLAKINSADSVDMVLLYLRSDDANLRMGALDALKLMSAPVRARLESLLRDSDPDVRLLACEAVRAVSPAEATRLLSALLLSDPAVNVCGAAIEVLAEMGLPDALPALEQCARRFADQPFLVFAVKVACQRIGTVSP